MIQQMIGLFLRAITVHLNKQNSPIIIDRLGLVIAAANSTVKGHDRCHGAVDFLCGFFFVRLDVACRVGADEDVVHHPAENGMSTVGDFLFQHQLHQLLGGRGHILEALSERNDREAHALKVLHHNDYLSRLTIATAQEAAILLKHTKPRRRIAPQRGSLMC